MTDLPEQLSAKAEAILEGAMGEFLTHGYAATSMDRVAAAARVSKATIYSHFRDKADLFAAIAHRLVEHKFSTIVDPRQRLQGPPRLVIRRLALTMYEQAQNDRRFNDFMRLIIGESGRFPELARPYIEEVAAPVIGSLSNYLKSRQELCLKDTEATARILVGSMVYFVIVQDILHGKAFMPMEVERIVDTLLDLIDPVA